MPMKQLEHATKIYKALSITAGGAAALIPGASFFVNQAPPFFESSSLLTTGIAIGVLLKVALSSESSANDRPRALAMMVAAVVLTIFYSVGTRYWTLGPPPDFEGPHIQTGFHLADWSLTPQASKYLRENPNSSPQDLMLAFGAYGTGLPVHRIWRTWTIVLAGTMLCSIFALGFVLWTYGFALLARSLSGPRRRKR